MDLRVFLALVDHVVEDVETVVEALTGDGAGRLHVEDVGRSQFMETQMFFDLFGILGAGQILFIGQHQNRHLSFQIPKHQIFKHQIAKQQTSNENIQLDYPAAIVEPQLINQCCLFGLKRAAPVLYSDGLSTQDVAFLAAFSSSN